MMAFGRSVEIIIGTKVIKYPELELTFDLNFDTGSDGNTGNIKVYNLSSKTIQLLKKNELVVIKAGYKGDIDEIFRGGIDSSITKWSDADKETEIIIGDHTEQWLNSTINKTWGTSANPNRTASQIIKDIVDELPLEIGKLEIDKDKTYSRGKTFSCTCKEALEELAKELDLKVHVSKGKVYFCARENGPEQIVILNKDTGLIGSPQLIQEKEDKVERYKIQSLLNYRIESDSYVKIESKTINGYYRVEKLRHGLNGDDFLTELEVVKYES